jgi:ABC-type transport system substrate-binding protein
VLRHPSGTGPLRFVSWEPNARNVLERNPHDFKPGLPYLDRVEYRVMKEGVTRVAALRAGGGRLRHRCAAWTHRASEPSPAGPGVQSD